MRKCFPSQAAPRPLLEKILSLLKDYQSEVQTVEWRLHGSSILIIYEGDPDRLVEGLQQSADQLNETPLEGDESDADSEDEPAPDFRPAVLVKAVDFAHAWDYRGHGPDSGYNEGVANFIALVQARLEEAGEVNS
jgi:1D-myo-inositol-tetrakisphosphate 5-kinase/inositol-polyphosphate multikinase